MALLTRQAIPLLVKQYQDQLPDKFRRFQRILLHDGSYFPVHDNLKKDFTGRFKTVSPATVEYHVTMSLLEQAPIRMSVAPDTISEHRYLPAASELGSCCCSLIQAMSIIATMPR